METGRLLVRCADRPGIVAAVSQFLYEAGANIAQSDQYSSDPEGGHFFLRMVFGLPGLADRHAELEERFAPIARSFGMDWQLHDAARRKRVALMVSRHDHCLLDLLWRWRREELDLDVAVVISNHPELAEAVAAFGVPFVHVPVTAETKPRSEERQLELLHGACVDLVVLARYMQILSSGFLERAGVPVINIHHSFLPAFAGADPYERARRRGVKIIGATAHYVTEELDEGPIIEQDVARVTHRLSATELARVGADIERTVLARAVTWHCADRVLVHANTTVVF